MTSIGVVEKITNDLIDPDKIEKEVRKKTVYTRKEIEIMAQRPTKVIIFYHNFHFSKSINLNTLLREKIISGYPQSIQEISHEKYLKIKDICKIDKKYCIGNLKH